MADEEFEKLQKKNKLNQTVDLAELGNDKNLVVREKQLEDTKIGSPCTHSNYLEKKKRKIVKRKIHKHVNLFPLRSTKTKRFKPCYSVCFKW
ncbi:MAG: hypothetical protein V4511_11610 [Bacteroidota bacterium]